MRTNHMNERTAKKKRTMYIWFDIHELEIAREKWHRQVAPTKASVRLTHQRRRGENIRRSARFFKGRNKIISVLFSLLPLHQRGGSHLSSMIYSRTSHETKSSAQLQPCPITAYRLRQFQWQYQKKKKRSPKEMGESKHVQQHVWLGGKKER
jgi:hypothetical protein